MSPFLPDIRRRNPALFPEEVDPDPEPDLPTADFDLTVIGPLNHVEPVTVLVEDQSIGAESIDWNLAGYSGDPIPGLSQGHRVVTFSLYAKPDEAPWLLSVIAKNRAGSDESPAIPIEVLEAVPPTIDTFVASGTAGVAPYTPTFSFKVSGQLVSVRLILDPETGHAQEFDVRNYYDTSAESVEFIHEELFRIPGTYNVTLEVVGRNNETVTDSIEVVVAPLAVTLSIPTKTLAPAFEGLPYTQALTAEGGTGAYTWTITAGTLPDGLTLNRNGVISGTPSNTSSGVYNLTFQVTSTGAIPATVTLTIVVIDAELAIGTTALPRGTVGREYEAQLRANGGIGSYVWTVESGVLPAGLVLDSDVGLIHGTPIESGDFPITLRATSGTEYLTVDLTLSVLASSTLQIVTTGLPLALEGGSYHAPLAAAGGTGTATWDLAYGELPSGLVLDSDTQAITGIPNVGTRGSYTIGVRATSGALRTTKEFILVVEAPVVQITTTSPLPPATEDVAYSTTLVSIGGTGAYTYSVVDGALPSGLNLNGATGVISGTPGSSASGQYSFRVRSASGSAIPGEKGFILVVLSGAQVTITTTTLPNAAKDTGYSAQISATGGNGPYTYAIIDGALPGGLSLNTNTGVITGTTTSDPGRIWTFRVRATASSGADPGIRDLSITTVAQSAVTITTTTLSGGQEGVAYSRQLVATGGFGGSYIWSLASGTLPPGLSLNTSTGVISGTPNYGTAATYTFTVRADARSSVFDTQALSITIAAAPTLAITTVSLPPGSQGQAYSGQLAASGGTGSYSWALAPGSSPLPAGIVLNASTGALTGSPTNSGNFNPTFRVTSGPYTANAQIPISIAAPAAVQIITTSLPGAIENVPYSAQVQASGGNGTYTFTRTAGTLPPGLSLNASTGVISGTPTPGTAAGYMFTITVDSPGATPASREFTIVVSVPPQLTGNYFADALIGAGSYLTNHPRLPGPDAAWLAWIQTDPNDRWTHTGSAVPGILACAQQLVASGVPPYNSQYVRRLWRSAIYCLAKPNEPLAAQVRQVLTDAMSVPAAASHEKEKFTLFAWMFDQLYSQWTPAQHDVIILSLRRSLMSYWTGSGLGGLGEQCIWNDPLNGRVGIATCLWMTIALYPDAGGPVPAGWNEIGGINTYVARAGRLYHEYAIPGWRMAAEGGGWPEGTDYWGEGRFWTTAYQSVIAVEKAFSVPELARQESWLRWFWKFARHMERPDFFHVKVGDSKRYENSNGNRLRYTSFTEIAFAYNDPTAISWCFQGPHGNIFRDPFSNDCRPEPVMLPWGHTWPQTIPLNGTTLPTSANLQSSELHHHATGIKVVFARSDWTEDAAHIYFRVDPGFWSHSSMESGDFAVYHNGSLLQRACTYAGVNSHTFYYWTGCISKNVMVFEDPQDTIGQYLAILKQESGTILPWNDPRVRPWKNNGGQKKRRAGLNSYAPAQSLTATSFTRGPIRVRDKEERDFNYGDFTAGPELTTPYVYAKMDLTPAYYWPPNPRSFSTWNITTLLPAGNMVDPQPGAFYDGLAYVPPYHRTDRLNYYYRTFYYRRPNVLVVVDRFNLKRTNIVPWALFQFPGVPTVVGNVATYVRNQIIDLTPPPGGTSGTSFYSVLQHRVNNSSLRYQTDGKVQVKTIYPVTPAIIQRGVAGQMLSLDGVYQYMLGDHPNNGVIDLAQSTSMVYCAGDPERRLMYEMGGPRIQVRNSLTVLEDQFLHVIQTGRAGVFTAETTFAAADAVTVTTANAMGCITTPAGQLREVMLFGKPVNIGSSTVAEFAGTGANMNLFVADLAPGAGYSIVLRNLGTSTNIQTISATATNQGTAFVQLNSVPASARVTITAV